MRNNDFIQQYVDGNIVEGAHGRMAYKNGRLISYNTVICDIDRVHKIANVNTHKYSSTTSRMQGVLMATLKKEDYEVRTYDGADAYIWDAWDARDMKVTVGDVDSATC